MTVDKLAGHDPGDGGTADHHCGIHGMGALRCWINLTLYVMLLFAVTLWRYRQGKWKKIRIIEGLTAGAKHRLRSSGRSWVRLTPRWSAARASAVCQFSIFLFRLAYGMVSATLDAKENL
jgi:hypothetical protein